MTARRPGPIARLALGLTFMTISIVLTGLMLDIGTDTRAPLLDARKSICETLALHVTQLMAAGDLDSSRKVLTLAAERSEDLLSAGLRSVDGTLLVEVGEHAGHWREIPLDRSTPNYAQVPIYAGGERWGTLEARFVHLGDTGIDLVWLLRLLSFVAVAGFLGYWLLMRRALRELDPSAVVPGRVRAAMNALAEGVMLLDERGVVVLVNDALCQRLGRTEASLLAQPLSGFRWSDPRTGAPMATLPWSRALRSGERQTGVALCLQPEDGEPRTFVTNVVPVGDEKGSTRGALVTFDDVTEVERKNGELERTLTILQAARDKVELQNRHLERLATRDPLTDLLNRRAFFDSFERLLRDRDAHGGRVACVMTDIDHFKAINDTYGHATGDEVIKLVASVITEHLDAGDLACRYGGEEFCLVLPGRSLDEAAALCEAMRSAVETGSQRRFTSGGRVTSSFGVAMLDAAAPEAVALVQRADEALYAAKEGGRNRVVRADATDRGAGAVELGAVPLPPPPRAAADADGRIAELQQALVSRTRALRHRHTHDPDTRLPNRLLFQQRVSQAIAAAAEDGRRLAVMSLSLDTVQRVSAALGRGAGDRLMRTTARRLQSATQRIAEAVDGRSCTLARLGEDEFGLLLSPLEGSDRAARVVRRLLEALSEPAGVDGQEVHLGASIGVAAYPQDGADAERLLVNAAAARRTAREQDERNGWRMYHRDMNGNALRELTLETLLRRALERDEFVLHYQPKVDLASGRIGGVEALIRWNQSEMGMVSPGEFVPVAEETGLIGAIGEWALDEACRQASQWRADGVEGLSVAVNVSALQFRDPVFAERVATRLQGHGLPPQMLELELTESTIMRDFDVAASTIRELAGMGVRIAVDDFGTGHSSLAYLRAFPVHSLKIDRSFLNEIEQGADETLVAAIAAMGRGLGLRIVAEGVERATQLPLLRRHRCHDAQGFLFCRPLPADDIGEILAGRTELPALRDLGETNWRSFLRRGRAPGAAGLQQAEA